VKGILVTDFYIVITLLAGIRAPTTERVNPSNQQVQPAEEYGNEARLFVEDKLLQRNVKVNILGLSPQNQIIATVVHPSGLIAKALLEAGLARCVDFHSTLLGPDMAALRQAEKVGQAAKRGLFKDHVTKTSAQGGNLEAQVTRVVGADVILVRNRAGVEKRISLSSIRGPRTSEAAESPFRDEAREYLRKMIIGKHVRLSIDGSRAATEEYEAREAATVSLNDKNIGLQLVQDGWCSVIRHRRDDTDRAPNYDELLVAQEKAKEDKKGMWSGKPAKVKQYADASENLQKAKIHLSTLQRQKKIPAVVDFVKGGSRFVILIPRENIKLTFVLGGIRAPRSARSPNEKSEPFGQEAHDLAARRLTQRDVEIDVHNVDKVGGFIGELYVNKESFAKILVDEGFATVHAYSAEQSGNATTLLAAEQRAKNARKGLWVDWDPSMDVLEEDAEASKGTNDDAAPIAREKDYRDVVVTNIDESGNLKVQIIGTGTAALETMMTQFKSFHLNPSNAAPLPGPPKAGEYVSAKFTEDDSWYRARIRSNDRTVKEAEVVYIDYGNSEKIPWSRLRPLPQAQFSPQKLRPQAVDAVLSLLQLPTNKDYLAEAVSYINGITANKELVANVDFTSPEGTLYITLYDPQHSEKLTDSINSDIISAGFAMVPTKLKSWERGFGDVLKVLREKMEIAKDEHLGMWEYGDPTED
jgi:staphylococcal nuclease domain-containing protein 1